LFNAAGVELMKGVGPAVHKVSSALMVGTLSEYFLCQLLGSTKSKMIIPMHGAVCGCVLKLSEVT
jgi:hypothetical protein